MVVFFFENNNFYLHLLRKYTIINAKKTESFNSLSKTDSNKGFKLYTLVQVKPQSRGERGLKGGGKFSVNQKKKEKKLKNINK